MSTYREIIGKKIKKVSSDPSSGLDGQMWYNSTTGNLRGLAISQAWSSSSPLITARGRNQGAGTQTAGLSFGGMNPPTLYANTEEYNGTGWTTGGALPTTIFDHAGDGTQTAAFSAGGQPTDPGSATTATCSYNGTSWTSLPALSTARKKITGLGASSTAALVFGGQIEPPGASTNASEEYSGSSWTTGGTLNSVRSKSAGAGTQTAGLGFGGYMPSSGPGSPGKLANTETYDGTSWSEVNDMNTARDGLGGFGTQTSALGAGGNSGSQSTATETWDGTNWTTSPATLGTATVSMSSAGTTSEGWIAGGYNPPGATGANTEEYNSSLNVIIAGAWASGGNLNTARYENGGTGSQTAGLTSGGGEPSYSNKTEEYDGSSWSNVTAYPISTRGMGAAGTQTSALFWGGDSPPGATITTTNEYDGSSWTSGGALTYDITTGGTGGTGTQTAGLMIAGYHKPENTAVAYVQEYNGSAWSANPNAYPTATFSVVQTGTATAALAAGGETPAPATPTNSFEYDGTSFSAGGALIEATVNAGAGGIQTDAITMGKSNNSRPTAVQGYNGTSFSTRPSISLGRAQMASGKNASPAATAWFAGGYTTTVVANTEEFTGETTAGNIKNFTTS